MTAKSRYDALSSGRTSFLDIAVQCSELTLPYLIQRDEMRSSHKTLTQPWQSVGAKAVVTLASKVDAGSAAASDYVLQVTDCR